MEISHVWYPDEREGWEHGNVVEEDEKTVKVNNENGQVPSSSVLLGSILFCVFVSYCFMII